MSDTASRTKVADIRERAEVRGSFLVRASTLRTARNGKPYLTLELGDRTGSIEGRAWDDAERLHALCEVGAVVDVAGRASSYQGRLQLNVDGLQPIPPEAVVLEDFLPRSDYDLDELYEALRAIVADIRDPWIRRLLEAIVTDPALAPKLRVAPAAKYMHHAYLGGLVEHVVSMCRVAAALADHYEALYPGLLDRDLLIAGVVLHDLGKTVEIGTDAAFDYTDEGRLVGHIVIGVELVTEKARGIEHFPDDLLARLKHLVVAHHGKLEYGAPRTPAMAEALLLHFVDVIDARMNGAYAACRDEAGNGWTRYSRMLEASLLNPFGATPVDEEGRALLPERTPEWLAPAPPPAEPPAPRAKRRPKRAAGEAAAPTEGTADAGTDEDEGPSNLSLF